MKVSPASLLRTDLTALQSFSAFVATGILFVYIFQITFFMGFLALDARREERALRGYGKGRAWFLTASRRQRVQVTQDGQAHE